MSFAQRFTAAVRSFRNPVAAKVPEGEIAMADPRRLFPGGWITPYNPSWLVSRKGLRIFDEMRRDDQVKAALAFKKHTILASGWTITSPEGKPKDWEVTGFVRHVLGNLDHGEVEGTFEHDLLEILSALDYGFSCTEKVWAPIEDGEFAGQVGLRALKTRTPHDIGFDQDEFGNLRPDGVVQAQNIHVKDGRMPADKFVIYVHEARFGNLYGVSDLEAAYRPWWLKENAYKWLAMLLERLGIPPVFGLYNPARYTATQIDDLKQVIQNLQAATFGIIPRPDEKALDFWAPELANQATSVFVPSLDMLNKDISRAILMPGLLGMTPDLATGSYARAQVQFDVFMEVVEYQRRTLRQTAVQNQIVRPLVDLNYGSLDGYPVFEFLPISDEVRLDILGRWTELVSGRVVTPQEEDETHIRRMMHFPERQAGAGRPLPIREPADNGRPPQDEPAARR
jgi:phage gp29-like protein